MKKSFISGIWKKSSTLCIVYFMAHSRLKYSEILYEININSSMIRIQKKKITLNFSLLVFLERVFHRILWSYSNEMLINLNIKRYWDSRHRDKQVRLKVMYLKIYFLNAISENKNCCKRDVDSIHRQRKHFAFCLEETKIKMSDSQNL